MADQDTSRDALFALVEKLAEQLEVDAESAPANFRPTITEQAAKLAEAWAWLSAPASAH